MMTPIPFMDLKRFEEGFTQKVEAEWSSILKRASFIGDPLIQKFESSLSAYTKTNHAMGCSNGTDAITLALRAAGVSARDTVLLPNFTFWATFEVVQNLGATPVLVEISQKDFQMDFELFKEAAKKFKPKAAILVHLYGWASRDLFQYRRFCKEEGIPLIEDAAQAFGTKVGGTESIHQSAYLSTVSFYPAKVLGGAGDAGAVFCQDEALAERLRSLANHGRSTHLTHQESGINARLDSLQAAFLYHSLPHLDARIASRKQTLDRYREEIKAPWIQLLTPPPSVNENAYVALAKLSDPTLQVETVQEDLKEKGISTGRYYPHPISDNPPAQKCTIWGNSQSKLASRELLCLPLFPYMTTNEVETVIQGINALH